MVKKLGTWFLVLALAAGLVVNLAACSDDDNSDEVTVTEYTLNDADLGTVKIEAKSDGTYVATATINDTTVTVEEGTWEKDGVTLKAKTLKKYDNESNELKTLETNDQYTTTYTIRENNVLTEADSGNAGGDGTGSSGTGSGSGDGTGSSGSGSGSDDGTGSGNGSGGSGSGNGDGTGSSGTGSGSGDGTGSSGTGSGSGDGTGSTGTGSGSGDGTDTPAGTTYAWDFSATALTTTLAWTANAESGSTVTGTELQKVKLEAAGSYESTPAGLTMSLAENAAFNKVSPAGSVSNNYSTIKDDASAGSLEPEKGTLLSVSVNGPFTAEMLCGANSSSDKTDRYAFIKIGDEEVAAPNKSANKLLSAGEKLSYAYTGTDTVTVSFGATGIVRIHDIKITTASEVTTTGKTAGEVKSTATFTAQTDDSTANDADTLGLVGTSAASSDGNVATAEIADDKVKISSVGAGTATIYVSDTDASSESANRASIAVTVNATGAVTVGKITKYVSADTPTISYFAGYDSNSTLSYAPTAKNTTGWTIGNATFTAVKDGIGEANMNAAKSVYGLSTGNSSQISTSVADEEFFKVTFTVKPNAAVSLSNIKAYGGCNKTSAFKVVISVNGGSFSNKELVSKNGTSNVAEIDTDISGASLVADTEYTFTVSFQSTKNQTYSAADKKQFTLANLVLTF